jgi:[ribosomal protein S5]-alanine N-acetyltransferase
MLTIPTLTTDRLHLRPFTRDDCPRLQMLADDKRIADNVGFIHPYTLADAEKFLLKIADDVANDRGFALAIIRTETADLIGSIGFALDARNRRASFGYWIGLPFWGKGYMTEAARALVDHLFTAFELHRVTAVHHALNPASGRVMKKVGMTLEGTSREHYRLAEAFVDDVHYGILRSEWTARNMKT